MKILKHVDLIGKKIIFSYMTKDGFILATEDGCMFMTSYFYDEYVDDISIRTASPREVLDMLHKRDWIRNELGMLGVFDIEKYEEEQRIKREKIQEELARKKEEKEFVEYLRLKEKFEK